MKKILIVGDNMHVGGIQKALVNFLNANYARYDITLLLIYPYGELMSAIPKGVRVLSASRLVRPLGAYKSDLSGKVLGFSLKGALLLWAKCFSKKSAFRLAAATQRKQRGYDVAISFSHPSKKHDLRSCSAEFVLSKCRATQKICFVHGDYQNEANRCAYTDALYRRFDKVACCSASVRERFLSVLPELADRTYALRNFYDMSLCDYTSEQEYSYDGAYINLISVARLSSEKGLDRALRALAASGRTDVRYYLVGDGPMRGELEALVAETGLADRVFFIGETTEPAAYMKGADYLFVPSYHEAAPVVFDEAKALGLQILTTATTSAAEMVGDAYGVVCENSEEGILQALLALKKPQDVDCVPLTNDLQYEQLDLLLQ